MDGRVATITRNPPSVSYVCKLIGCDDETHPPLVINIMTHIRSPHSSLFCVHEPDNELGVGGARALVPALEQMPHMTTLNLESKSRMTRAHGG